MSSADNLRRSQRIKVRNSLGGSSRGSPTSGSSKCSLSSSPAENSPTNMAPATPPPPGAGSVAVAARRLLASTTPRRRSRSRLGAKNPSQGSTLAGEEPNPFATPVRRRLALTSSSNGSPSPQRVSSQSRRGSVASAAVDLLQLKAGAAASTGAAPSSPTTAKSRPVRLAFFESAMKTVALLGGDTEFHDEETATVAIHYRKQEFRFEFERSDGPGSCCERATVPFTAIRVMERNRGGFRLVLDPALPGVQFCRWSDGQKPTDAATRCPDFLFRLVPGGSGPAAAVDFDFYTRSMVDVHWRLLREDSTLGPTVARSITTDYAIREILGHGAQAVVRRAVRRVDGSSFAVKIIDKRAVPGSLARRVLDETEKLRSLPAHPNIVRVVEQYEDADRLFIVLEYMAGGELFHALHQYKRFPELPTTRAIMRQVLSALNHIHTLPVPIAHRDLKLENVLIQGEFREDAEPMVKLIDFGLSKLMQDGDRGQTVAGTPQYLAPEILGVRDGVHAEYTEACDLWSAGVMMYACVTGRLPFHRGGGGGGRPRPAQDAGSVGDRPSPPPPGPTSNEPMFLRICSGDYRTDLLDVFAVSSEGQSLISGLLCVDPSQRLTAQQALNHLWFHN